MKVLVLGATEATGCLVVKQLISRNIKTKIVVRDILKVSKDIQANKLVEIIVGSIYDFNRSKNLNLVTDCDAVVSCLGHNISFRGLFGKPRRLVENSVRYICEAIVESKKSKVKIILMNTTANLNKRANEKYSLADRIVLSVLSVILPPQEDNVMAARYLSDNIKKNNSGMEWVVIRPDTLINEQKESDYEIYESPNRSPVFNAGKTSRINVANFMVELLLNDELWNEWKFKMPVIYNK